MQPITELYHQVDRFQIDFGEVRALQLYNFTNLVNL